MKFQLKKPNLGKRSFDFSLEDTLEDSLEDSQIIKKKQIKPLEAQSSQLEEDDPLDAFMEQNSKALSLPSERKRIETSQEDPMDDYFETLEAKGIKIGSSGPVDIHKIREEGLDWQDEVQQDPEESSSSFTHVLPFTDHDEIQYIPIQKNFYSPHSDIEALSPERVQEIRAELDIHIHGVNAPKPAISFAHFGFDESLMDVIRKQQFSVPTEIQRQAIPCALSGRDVISVSATGSGKTAAYLWPMIVHIMDQPELDKGEGPIGLILCPTRELAQQIYLEAKRYGKPYGLRCAQIYGGVSKTEQFKVLKAGVEIVVATPGRWIDLIKLKATTMNRISFLVLDEADRMLDLGFEIQVKSICAAIRPDRQTLLFSATWPRKIEALTREILTDPIRIVIGNVGQANENVEQHVLLMNDKEQKCKWLLENISSFLSVGSVLIFVSKKEDVSDLKSQLQTSNLSCDGIHGDLSQYERESILQRFKLEKLKLLICTDVASRGLDIKSIKTVINFDIAKDIDTHVHRIGRTGRAGEKGHAYTLLLKDQDKFAGLLVRNLEAANQAVPQELINLAMRNHKFRKSRVALMGHSAIVSRGTRIQRGGYSKMNSSRERVHSSEGSSRVISFQKASSERTGK